MKKFSSYLFIALLFIILSVPTNAAIKLPSIFSDNMVLQQNTKVNMWGKANVGEKITVKCSWSKKNYSAITAANGTWKLQISTPKASRNQTLTIKGENSLTIHNILIGEIWLCTGQSNMEFSVAKDSINRWKTGMLNYDKELENANYGDIRLFQVEHQLAPDGEKDDCVGQWLVCNRENVRKFSAIGFVFGRKLYKELNQPIGLIQSTWGGTHAESWTKMEVMRDNPLYQSVIEKYRADKIKNNDGSNIPSTLWNGMIAPILPYTLKGNIWYQGESNAYFYQNYQELFTNMINSWRKEWKQADMPFYFVQIAPYYDQPAGIREAQLNTWQSVKHTGMVVITDVGDSADIHPRNKIVPGERLAAWALANQYGKKITYASPVYKKLKIKGNKAIVSFTQKELKISENEGSSLTGFFIAGSDRCFYPAVAQITDDGRVEVLAPEVNNPVAVRYGYNNFFRVNLSNQAGLPASPFRTDNWDKDTKTMDTSSF